MQLKSNYCQCLLGRPWMTRHSRKRLEATPGPAGSKSIANFYRLAAQQKVLEATLWLEVTAQLNLTDLQHVHTKILLTRNAVPFEVILY